MKCDTDKQKELALNIINDEKDFFIAEVKLSSSDEIKNKFVYFPQ
jgi:hypothetical protein